MHLVGPVFWKELIEVARRKRYLLLRCVVPCLFFFMVFIIAVEERSRRTWSNETVLQQQNRTGRAFFDSWVVLVTFTVGIAAPLLVGGLIAAERERGSLELLFTTDLSSREIVLGKISSRISVLWLIVFGTAPVLELTAFLGGVSFARVVGVLALSLSGIAMICSAGLYYSAVTRRPWIAIVRTYFFFGVVWFLLPVAILGGFETLKRLFGFSPMTRVGDDLRWLVSLHLPICLMAQVEPKNPFGMTPGQMAFWNSVVSWGVSAIFLLLVHRNLRQSPSKNTAWYFAPFRWAGRFASSIGRALSDGLRSIIPDGVSEKFGATDRRMERVLDSQPVAWRNLQAAVFDPDRYLSRIQCFLAIVMFLFLAVGTIGFGPPPPRTFVAFSLFTLIVMQFLLGVLAAGSISRERERGSLDLLRMTMLTPHQLLLGNLVGAFRAVRIACWAFFFLLTYAVLTEVFGFYFTLQYAVVVMTGTCLVAVQSILISAAAPNATTAIAAAVVAGFLWWIDPLFFEDKEIRGWVLGLCAASAPWAFLPLQRRPSWIGVAVAAIASLGLFSLFGATRLNDAALPAVVCGIVALLSLSWLKSPLPIPRLVAAVVCCVLTPLAIGLTACSLFNVDLRSLEHVILYPRFIVEVDSTQLSNTGVLVRRGSSGWVNGRADWAATLFFFCTLISTGVLYRVALRAFPRMIATA